MNMRQYRRALLVIALAMGACQASLAQAYRCQRADGALVFQQTPCALPELGQPAATPAPPTVQPARAAAHHGEEAYALLTRRKREVLDLTARLERCRADQPGFAAKSSELVLAWRRRQETTLADYERLLALKVRELRRSAAVPLSLCSDEWLQEMEALARPPDPRFSSVEKTWSVFVGALLAADRATLLKCVTGTAAARLRERLALLTDVDLRRMGGTIRGLKVQSGDDYDKEGLVAHDDRVDGIAFRNVNEEWKIGNL